jgi:hypothetical protein
MLQHEAVPKMKESPRFNRLIFQQDGAPPHVAKEVKAFLAATFGLTKIISRGFPNEWPALSPDLTPLDFWLWSFLKDAVYPQGNRPPTLDNLKQRIENAAGTVTIIHLQNAVGNVETRLHKCLQKKAHTLNNFIFRS